MIGIDKDRSSDLIIGGWDEAALDCANATLTEEAESLGWRAWIDGRVARVTAHLDVAFDWITEDRDMEEAWRKRCAR